MKRVLCLYTGGTIGCLPGPQGLAPVPGVLNAPLLALADELSLQLCLQEYPELLDSSSMGPADWNRIGNSIASQYGAFDAFVVLHGTDTLAYTAAALSFQLEQLDKPVILTGSQRPWHQDGSDAPDNVKLALQSAMGPMRGVCVAFGGKLMPGRHVRKIDSMADIAFDAPDWDGSWPAHRDNCGLRFTAINPDSRVIGIKLYPGASYDWLSQALDEPLQGIVLECYGSGNLPDHPGLINALKRQAAAGAIIICCTQCLRGGVQQGLYASSIAGHIDSISGGNMTPEAALAKLYWLLAEKQTD